MSTQLVPYSFNTSVLPTPSQVQGLPGQYQVVHFTLIDPDLLDTLLDKIRLWFSECDEVLLVDHGTTAAGLGFVVMEWGGCTIDPLFLAILKHEEAVDDVTVYTRDGEAS